MNKHLYLIHCTVLLWVWACAISCSDAAAGVNYTLPTTEVTPYVLGVTSMSIAKATGQPSLPLFKETLQFLNLHQNENTSVVAAKTLSLLQGGSVTFLRHGHTRDVSFQLKPNGTTYTFDPNRMFTPKGLKASLELNTSPKTNITADVIKAAGAFATQVLKSYGVFTRDRKLILTLHNNSPGYSASSYLPGGPFANDAAKVYINPNLNPRNFLFVVDDKMYQRVVSAGINCVLQKATGANVTDDGSLSVWAAQEGYDYVNIEAAAAGGSEGDQVVTQLWMLLQLSEILNPIDVANPGTASTTPSRTTLFILVAAFAAAFVAALVMSLQLWRSSKGDRSERYGPME